MNILLFPYDYFPVCFQEEETALLSFTGEGLKSDNSVADVDLKYLKPFVFTPPPSCLCFPGFENRWLLIKSGRNQYIFVEAVER